MRGWLMLRCSVVQNHTSGNNRCLRGFGHNTHICDRRLCFSPLRLPKCTTRGTLILIKLEDVTWGERRKASDD
ncbi:hypothetical protein AcV7_009174 [Taiwanofungus camphoratus]|nr:hypothetical protein AcV7_009174 [Antrodia cinnamomea]